MICPTPRKNPEHRPGCPIAEVAKPHPLLYNPLTTKPQDFHFMLGNQGEARET